LGRTAITIGDFTSLFVFVSLLVLLKRLNDPKRGGK
jgi:hypothetical protein